MAIHTFNMHICLHNQGTLAVGLRRRADDAEIDVELFHYESLGTLCNHYR